MNPEITTEENENTELVVDKILITLVWEHIWSLVE